jgi:RNase P/RNase MRP subunit POP5
MIFKRKLRYVLVEATENVNLGNPIVADGLKRSILSFLGHLPHFKANPQVATQIDDRRFVISVNRGHERGVVLALSFIKSLQGKRLGFYTLRTSGTIATLKELARKLDRNK